MVRRILGLFILLIGVAGVAIAIVGLRMTHQLLDSVGTQVDSGLQLTSESLDNVNATLLLAKDTVADVAVSMNTIQTTTLDLAQTLEETRPLIEQSTLVATEQVPDSIEAVQEAIPALTDVAGTIDSTLATLSRFRIDREILGFQFNYDLGINYDPEVPFDDAVIGIGSSLEGLPESLRALAVYLEVANDNLQNISDDIYLLSEDLDRLNANITELDPILDEYIRLVTELNDTLRGLRQQISEQIEIARNVATIAFIWLGLTQLMPLYFGYELLSGKRDPDRYISRAEFEAWQNGQKTSVDES
jgi:methyl-accepting chemotaxis protein